MANRIKGKSSAFQYWVRSRECDLQVGIKHRTWYGTEQELGSSKMPKKAILRTSVEQNIPTIIEIESKYLTGLEDTAAALRNTSENEYQGGDE